MATLAAVGALGLAGCGSPVALEPAPSASDVACAELLLALPEQIGDAERRSTTTQASRAWGDPAIELRCGVTALGPTTDRCIQVVSADETSIDWVVDELGAQEQGRGSWTFTTYGRIPAVEVTVPVEQAGGDPQLVLIALAPAVADLPQDRACL